MTEPSNNVTVKRTDLEMAVVLAGEHPNPHDIEQTALNHLRAVLRATRTEQEWANQFSCPNCGPITEDCITTAKTCLTCGACLNRHDPQPPEPTEVDDVPTGTIFELDLFRERLEQEAEVYRGRDADSVVNRHLVARDLTNLAAELKTLIDNCQAQYCPTGQAATPPDEAVAFEGRLFDVDHEADDENSEHMSIHIDGPMGSMPTISDYIDFGRVRVSITPLTTKTEDQSDE